MIKKKLDSYLQEINSDYYTYKKHLTSMVEEMVYEGREKNFQTIHEFTP